MITKIYFLRDLLEKSFKTRGKERFENINSFLNEVWEDEVITDAEINDFLTDIADDLENYEPNDTWRAQNATYYGDKKLNQILEKAIKDIDALLVNLKNVIDVTVSKK